MTLTWAFIRKELATWRQDPTLFVFLFAAPLLMQALLSDAFSGITGGAGANQTVPGFTIMFGFYVMMFMGTSHYREHASGAWTLVRSSGLSRGVMAIQLAIPYFLLSAAQMTLLVLTGRMLFGGTINGSPVALAVLVVTIAWTAIALGLVLTSLTRNVSAMQNLCQLVVLGMGAVGGAIVPVRLMPAWDRPLAPLTPQYWAVDGMRRVLTEHGGLASIAQNLAVLIGWACVLSIIATVAFDPGSQRRVAIR
ncbi:ABC transporter permease [Nocardia pseudobrasiliensis]|uniref:Transport permease protein n=1 Tax=Nocardia pseudobrasiliensis TaxID=45979 RepID=A0A370I844_9NOCA|nr:ABC transporter permease [Nocardia pseudobrasiliensis]RDI65534.1 ABC-2 type transport system permease protein [Nocardia pseudobrasiliensis]